MKQDRLVILLKEAVVIAAGGGKVSVPEPGKLAWQMFCDLTGTRSYAFGGPNPIGHAEIEAYARLHRWPLRPHHIALIRAMDDAWMVHIYRKQEATKAGKGKTTFDGRSAAKAHPVTASSFDAVFG